MSVRRIRRRSDGGLSIRLPANERALLSVLPRELAPLLEAVGTGPPPEPLRRLFPVVYPSDGQAEAAYRELVREGLLEEHRQALEVLASTAGADQLDAVQAEGWLAALNVIRLVLGSTLGVTEESSEAPLPEEQRDEWTYYHYLSFLMGEIVEELAKGLPKGRDEDQLPDDPWGEPPGGLRWDGTPQPD